MGNEGSAEAPVACNVPDCEYRAYTESILLAHKDAPFIRIVGKCYAHSQGQNPTMSFSDYAKTIGVTSTGESAPWSREPNNAE